MIICQFGLPFLKDYYIMDRSNSLNGNLRSFTTNTNSPHQKLTHRLTNKPSDSNNITRLPSNHPHIYNPTHIQAYSQVKRGDWRDIISPKRQFSTSPITLVPYSPPLVDPNEETIVSSKITKSYLSSSTAHDLERECRVLKQTIDNQKTMIKQLQESSLELKSRLANERNGTSSRNGKDLKNKLQETEQRMGQENAYLRECMLKLHEQLENMNNESVQKELETLREENLRLSGDLEKKIGLVRQIQEKYDKLVSQLQEQSATGGVVASKLQSLEENIFFLESENKSLQQSHHDIQKHNQYLESTLEQEKRAMKEVLAQKHSLVKERDNYKQVSEELQKYINKLKRENSTLNKSMQSSITPRSGSSISSSHLHFHLEKEREKEKERVSLSQIKDNTKSLSKISSYQNISNQQQPTTSVFSYINRIQEFNSLLATYYLQTPDIPPKLQQILTLSQAFSHSIETFLNQDVKNKQIIEKYKRLVESIAQGGSYKVEGRVSEAVNDLIEKCNLLESSVKEKKSMIEEVSNQLMLLRREREGESLKSNRHYKSSFEEGDQSRLVHNKSEREKDKERYREKEIEKELSNRAKSNTKNKHNQSTSVTLEKLKLFKPLPFVEQRESQNTKLKPIQGEGVNKAMQNKLKAYEQEIVPKLQAQIDQYKVIITNINDSKDKCGELLMSSNQSDKAEQDTFRGSRMWSHSFDKRKERIGTIGVSQPFQNQSTFDKPGSSDGTVSSSKKKRLDLINRSLLNKDVVLILIYKLVEIALTMTRNSNFMIIVPDSIYIINYSQDRSSFPSAKLKVLESSKTKTDTVKQYWSPQISKGSPFNQKSLVWNLGVIFDEIIRCKGCFSPNSSHPDKADPESNQLSHPFFKKLMEKMLEPDWKKRCRLQEIQQLIVNQGRHLLK